MAETFIDYNNFKPVFVSSKMDVYGTKEKAEGKLPENKPNKLVVDATVTCHRNKIHPLQFNGFDISEARNDLVSIINAKKVGDGVAPGVDYIKIYKGYVDNNHNGEVENGEPEVIILTYYPHEGIPGNVELRPLEGIRIIKE